MKLKRILLLIVMATIFTTGVAGNIFGQRRGQPAKPKPQPAQGQKSGPKVSQPAEPPVIKLPETPLTVEQMEQLRAVIETDKGNMTIEFYPKSAPNHVRQFVWLAQNGYFDGMSFSRVIPKYIIQSGNPSSWDEQNPNHKKKFDIPKLKAEYDPNIKHVRGALSMARPNGEPDGATTHFFICALSFSSLDNQYSIFGHVVEGIDLIDTIAAVPIVEGTPDTPKERVEIKHVVIKEVLKEAVPKTETKTETNTETKSEKPEDKQEQKQ